MADLTTRQSRQVSRNNLQQVDKIKTIQAVMMQHQILDKKRHKTKPESTNQEKDHESSASAKKRKTNKQNNLWQKASGCQHW